MSLEGIHKALKDGCLMQGFCAGSRVRVVCLKKDNKLKGQGEHPNVEGALAFADADFLRSERSNGRAYGETVPLYAEGSSLPSSEFDRWLLRGQTFDAWQDGNDVVLRLNGYAHTELPKMIERAVKQSGFSITWNDRGFTYCTKPALLPNGQPTVRTAVIRRPAEDGQKKRDAWHYRITKTGRGVNFFEALEAALVADEVEE